MCAWQKRVQKTVFTLNVDGYSPEMTALTYPLLKAYARKIDADFHVISERKFPEWPVTFEKLQIYELAQQMENDWNIYIDADALVHPDTPDLTSILDRDTVAHFGSDFAPARWRSDRFFRRDGRHISSGNWLAIASDLCIDLWKPPDDLTPAKAIANIQPSVAERVGGVVTAPHLIDDYLLSRNIAKYGLKYVDMRTVLAENYDKGGGFFFHHYLLPLDQKLDELQKCLEAWRVNELMPEFYRELMAGPVDQAEKIEGWMSREELRWLYETAQKMDSIVEIGSYKGRSTYALLSGCKGPVYAVDPFNEGQIIHDSLVGKDTYDDFIKNVGHFPNLHARRMTSEAAAADSLPPVVDMVFIDGNHEPDMVTKDLALWAPRARRLVCGHDYNDPQWPGVKQALNEYFPEEVSAGPGSLWWKRIEP